MDKQCARDNKMYNISEGMNLKEEDSVKRQFMTMVSLFSSTIGGNTRTFSSISPSKNRTYMSNRVSSGNISRSPFKKLL